LHLGNGRSRGTRSNAKNPNGSGNVFDFLFAQISEAKIEPVTYLLVCRGTDADSTRFGQRLEAGGNVDPIAE
jgi:hypothetical protein